MEREIVYDVVVFDEGSEVGKLVGEGLRKEKGLNWTVTRVSSEEVGMSEENSSSVLEIRSIEAEKISALVKKTKVAISLLEQNSGAESVLETCAKNGVHCVTPSYKTPWLADIIRKYHDIAQENRTMIIVGLGAETAPQDLLAYISATELRRKLQIDTREVVFSQPETKSSRYPRTEKRATRLDPWSLSPVRGNFVSERTNAFGARKDLTLGHLSTSKNHYAQAIVHRSWGLLDPRTESVYGPNFCFNEFVERNSSTATLKRKLFGTCCVPRESIICGNDRTGSGLSLGAVAIAHQEGPYPDRALSELKCAGTTENLTAVLLVQGAITILNGPKAKEIVGDGIVTPAMLGFPLISQLKEAGLEIESMLV
ncbi:uncharacterized protein LY89DRAFT_785834 [Mollisia scopiformis]|uniref:Saccharopine dehydrogenase NADP binding domain-containing protein n=1 Tax=Mollisia scopiformis TaxID=149040 RepID=A0A194WX25_MOLSC|nr:uncharacterized protein LY89DRAFT_785834 [Mollisia scopiformis]KUJ12485.1 hypothetical protein LY89DRAFT_785834 [Mollisia scopiformis]